MKRFVFLTALFAAALALPETASAQRGGRIDVPDIPAELTVEDGNVAYLQTHAVGTQNYICLPNGTAVAWKLFGPQATLYPPMMPLQVATHFLSANPEEFGLPRPTWQHSFDGSTVWARAIQPSTDSNYVEAGAIPWLLLVKVGTADGPTGGAQLSQTTFIHRVNTHGGAAPSIGCTSAAQIGSVVLVPYSTDYVFYRAEKKQ